MESEMQTLCDEANSVEFEELNLSDVEEGTEKANFSELNIDSNSRVTSKIAPQSSEEVVNCDTCFQDGTVNFSASASDKLVMTSDEEIDVSEEDIVFDQMLSLKHLDPERIACVASGLQSDSSMNFSSTNFKDEYATNEDLSDYDGDDKKIQSLPLISKPREKLSASSSITNVISAAKKMAPSIPSKSSMFSTSFSELFSDHLSEGENNSVFSIADFHSPKPKPGLITCLEFLTTQPVEDGLTDTEVFVDSSPEHSGLSKLQNDKDESVKNRVQLPYDIKHARDKRSDFYKKAQTAAILSSIHGKDSTDSETDDEILCFENEKMQLTKKVRKKHLKRIHEKFFSNENDLTDEEVFVTLNPEWTETDETGAIRQVTQIKTETSIKLDNEGGNDLEEDGDDMISRTTATTTTRIVTTVTTDDSEETADTQQSVLEGGDDLRHSVEVILNQFMSDDVQQDPSDVQTTQKE